MEEEILEVVERIRRSPDQEVTLIVPARSRLGRSRFNFQLLQRCAEQTGKRVTVTSTEPGIERMAGESGLAVEGGAAGWGPRAAPMPVEVGSAVPAASAGSTAPAGPGWPPAGPGFQAQEPWPAPAGPGLLSRVEPWFREGPGSEVVAALRAPRRGVLYLGAGIASLALLLLLVFFVPSATVT